MADKKAIVKVIPPRPTPQPILREEREDERTSGSAEAALLQLLAGAGALIVAGIAGLLDRIEDEEKLAKLDRDRAFDDDEKKIMALGRGRRRRGDERRAIEALEAAARDWNRAADTALAAGREDLAKAAIARKRAAIIEAEDMREQWEVAEQAAAELAAELGTGAGRARGDRLADEIDALRQEAAAAAELEAMKKGRKA